MKSKSINILIISFLMLGIMSIMLITFVGNAKEDFPENITVSADGVTEEILSVRELRLNPTESKEYSVNLVCAASGSFRICLDYEEKADGGMKPFVDVTVEVNDDVLYDGTLTELIDGGKTIEFEGELHETDPLIVTICYEMPRDVGNEAQGTFLDFDVNLKIEKI